MSEDLAMNYKAMTSQELREICRGRFIYKGYSAYTNKADLIKHMAYCDEKITWLRKSLKLSLILLLLMPVAGLSQDCLHPGGECRKEVQV